MLDGFDGSTGHPVKGALGIGLAVLLGGTVALNDLNAEVVFPGQTWQESSPAEQGMDGNVIDGIAEALGGRGVVIRNGYLVKRWGIPQRRGDLLDASNPLLSTLLWFAIEEGRVETVESKIDQYGWRLDSKDRDISFFQLANMISGYSRPEPSGMAWSYNEFGSKLFAMTLFDRVFNSTGIAAILHRDRLGSLQFEDRPVVRDRSRTLIASARDFARIAWFWCQKGKWGDRQLLPRHYFDRFFRPQVDPEIPLSLEAEANDYMSLGASQGQGEAPSVGPGLYGYGWWFNPSRTGDAGVLTWPDGPPDTCMVIGRRGNSAVLIPSLNLVLVSSFSKWGQLAVDDPESDYNKHIGALTRSVQ